MGLPLTELHAKSAEPRMQIKAPFAAPLSSLLLLPRKLPRPVRHLGPLARERVFLKQFGLLALGHRDGDVFFLGELFDQPAAVAVFRVHRRLHVVAVFARRERPDFQRARMVLPHEPGVFQNLNLAHAIAAAFCHVGGHGLRGGLFRPVGIGVLIDIHFHGDVHFDGLLGADVDRDGGATSEGERGEGEGGAKAHGRCAATRPLGRRAGAS